MTSNSQCPFCHLPPKRILLSYNVGCVVRDVFPVSPGHTLVIPKRHMGSFFDLSDDERNVLMALLAEARLGTEAEFSPAGYNIGINDGPAAGQTVPHLHIHLIPRFAGDLPDPRGGARWGPRPICLSCGKTACKLALRPRWMPRCTPTLRRWWGWTCLPPRPRCATTQPPPTVRVRSVHAARGSGSRCCWPTSTAAAPPVTRPVASARVHCVEPAQRVQNPGAGLMAIFKPNWPLPLDWRHSLLRISRSHR